MPATSSILPLGRSRQIYDRAYPTNARTEILSLISSSLSHWVSFISPSRITRHPYDTTTNVSAAEENRSIKVFLHSLYWCIHTLAHL